MNDGWNHNLAEAPDGTRILLLWEPLDGVSEHVELGRFSPAEGVWKNTYGKPFNGHPDAWAFLAPFKFDLTIADKDALIEEVNNRLETGLIAQSDLDVEFEYDPDPVYIDDGIDRNALAEATARWARGDKREALYHLEKALGDDFYGLERLLDGAK